MEFDFGELIIDNELDFGELELDVVKQNPPLINLEVTPTVEEQIFTHEGEYGYDIVTVKPIDLKLQDKEVDIQKEQQVITADNDYDALGSVIINAPELQDKTITPSEEEQEIYADDEFLALNSVKVEAIPEEYTKVEGTLTLTKNGEYDVKEYANVKTEIFETITLPEKDINFFDYDGTLLYSWSLEELADKISLPELPEHEGLLCQGWNWTLEDLQEQKVPMVVGATYITDDETTKIYIELHEGRLSPVLGVGQSVANGIEIDWGDGNVEISNTTRTSTSLSPKSINMTHTYENAGKYIITLKPLNQTKIYLFGDYSANSKILWKNSTIANQNSIYQTSLQKVFCGKNVQLGTYAFYGCRCLQEVTISEGTLGLQNNSIFSGVYLLKFIIIPKGITTLGSQFVNNCNRLQGISIPSEITMISNGMCSSCRALEHIAISRNITTIDANALSSCSSLRKMFFPNNTEVIGTGMFNGCTSLQEILFEEVSKIKTLPNNFVVSCSALKQLNLPTQIESIGNGAFNSCGSISMLAIPPTVIELMTSCLAGLYGIKYFDFSKHEIIPSLGNSNAFQGAPTDFQIVVPDDLYEEWIIATNWATVASNIIKVSEWEAQQ